MPQGELHMRRIYVVLMLLSAPLATMATETVSIQRTVPYADGTGSEVLRSQCNWNSELSRRIVVAAKGLVVVSDKDPNQLTGKVLVMTITSVHAVGGGNYSGPKWANVRGELREDSRVIGTFIANRTTTTGGGFTACSALNRVGKALAKDIANWLMAPTMDAHLGSAR
jgi:hypothetical protein